MPDHPHGTNDRYLNGPCRCPQCREAHRADGALRRRLIAYGTWQGRVDATDAQLHIKQLTADGMTYAAIARAAGLPDKQPIQDIANGQRTTSPQRLAAILAVTYQPPIRINHVPALGTYRRLEGLAAVGWSYQAIDDAAGSDLKTRNLMRKRPDTVRAETAKAVERAARHLITRTPPANRYTTLITNRARESGWVPIAVWDDVDNPDETPKTDRPTRAYHGRVTNPDPELIERIQRLHRQGLTDPQIAQAVGGRTASSVQKIRARHPVQETP